MYGNFPFLKPSHFPLTSLSMAPTATSLSVYLGTQLVQNAILTMDGVVSANGNDDLSSAIGIEFWHDDIGKTT